MRSHDTTKTQLSHDNVRYEWQERRECPTCLVPAWDLSPLQNNCDVFSHGRRRKWRKQGHRREKWNLLRILLLLWNVSSTIRLSNHHTGKSQCLKWTWFFLYVKSMRTNHYDVITSSVRDGMVESSKKSYAVMWISSCQRVDGQASILTWVFYFPHFSIT